MIRKTMIITIAALFLITAPATAKKKTTYPRSANSTAYCLSGTMANSQSVRRGSIAMNGVPFGTKIQLAKPGPMGRRRWVVRDRIGWGSEMDFWVPSCSYALNAWGRRTVKYRFGWSK